MSLLINRRRVLAGTAATGAALALGRPARAQDVTKVGFVYVGPISDHGWSYRHDRGRQAIAAHFGDAVETSYVENVAEGPDAERVIRQLASTGHQLIFTTSFGFMNPTIRVARQFPDVKFEHCTGYQRADNVATYMARFYEGRAICGTMAGIVSESGIVGYICSFPIPEVVRGINSFYLAASQINPDIQLKIVWVNSWYDPGKEGDAAKTLIDQGADILAQHTDSPAALQVAEDRGVLAFGQASDMQAFARNAQLTSIVDNWNDYYIARTQAVIDGTWTSGDTWGGLDTGMVEIAPYGPAVSPEVAAAADEVKAGIAAGELHPFAGPIANQAGEEVVAEGAVLSDEELLKMAYYVQGIDASLPQ